MQYVSPDDVYIGGYKLQAIPFTYHDGKMYYGGQVGDGNFLPNHDTIDSQYSLKPDTITYGQTKTGRKDWKQRNHQGTVNAIYGRIGLIDKEDGTGTQKYLTFWNSPNLATLLKPCIQQLIMDKKLTGDELVSVPGMAIAPLSKFQYGQQIDPEAAKKADLYRQLHLMRPEMKKQAMEELGVGKAPNSNYGLPGQKWWASQSESLSFKEWYLFIGQV